MKWFRPVEYAGIFLLLISLTSCNSAPDDRSGNPTPDNLSRKAEIEMKMLEGKGLHDGALELQTIGDMDSVPSLLVVLKENPPSSRGTMVCTAAHALMALRSITGENPGIRYEDWQKWYENRAKPPA